MKKRHSFQNFKNADDMDEYLEKSDLSEIFLQQGKLIKPRIKKVNLDLPENMVMEIDSVAARIGVSRQPLLKMWIHQMLVKENKDAA